MTKVEALNELISILEDKHLISDGYHTFKELYDFRKVYNALVFNQWANQGKYEVHKSKNHSDGKPCFDGNWFIVSAMTPYGQVSNHYHLKDWDLFNVPIKPKAVFEYDGHTASDVMERLTKTLKSENDRFKPPYVSDDFQIGYDGAYENES